MASSVLETVGQVAGIGGLALGVLLIVFRDIIRKNIFPRLPSEMAYRLLRLITVSVWSIAALGILAWVYTSTAAEGQVTASCGAVAIGRSASNSTIVAGDCPEGDRNVSAP